MFILPVPRPFNDVRVLLQSETLSAQYLAHVRWPTGFRCARCGSPYGWQLPYRPRVWACVGCKAQVSVTSGTAMHRSRTPLRKWIELLWLLGSPFVNHSIRLLAKKLRMHYATVWELVHKLQAALATNEPLLSGLVEKFERALMPGEMRPIRRAPPPTPPSTVLCCYRDPGRGVRFRVGPHDLPATGPVTDDRGGATTFWNFVVERIARVHRGVSARYLPRFATFGGYRLEHHRPNASLLHDFAGQMLRSAWVPAVELPPPGR